MHRMVGASVLLAAVVLAACEEKSKPSPAPVTWHKDIGPLMQQKCGACHVEGGIAPLVFQTYEQAHPRREAIKESVQSRHMPPWPPSNACAQYKEDRSLSDEQLALLTRWVDEGGPEGNPADAPASTGPRTGGLSRVDVTLRMPEAYTPQRSPDDYRCFLLDWPYNDVQYISGFRALPGSPTLVHHVIAYLAEPGDVAAAQALDAQEPGPGYTCFGGPGLKDGRTVWLGAWAPGGQGEDYPARTGLRIQPGSKVILQVHYNTRHGPGGPDQSEVAFKVDSEVDKVAFVQPWADTRWVDDKTMHIPAGQADVTHAWADHPTRYLSALTGGVFQDDKPITLHLVGLHMHMLGTRTRLDIQRGSGARECLLDIPRWDFNWQQLYTFVQPKVLNPGDALALECHWDNSAPGARDVNWGEGTSDEMCLGLFYMTQE